MNFGEAIEELKKGYAIRRSGWNGKGMKVYLNKGSYDFKPNDEQPDKIESIRSELFESGDAGTATRLPNINMRAETGSTVTGWLASQRDILAEDWEVLYEPEPTCEG